MTDSPASPAPVRLTGPLRSPPPCLNLDALSSDESAGPRDISAVPICISDDSSTSVNPDQVLSDDDLLTAVHVEDRRQVIRIRVVPPDVRRMIRFVIHDWQCGERSNRQLFRVVIRGSLFALWP